MADYFPLNYAQAREQFSSLAAAADARLARYPIAARGPLGEALSADAAYLGAAQPLALVVLTSAVHGVEGYAGSALQQLWLAEYAATLPPQAGVLLVHAVNPYGFAHDRRANEHNVDLNRNGLQQFPGPANPAYAPLDRWLNPPSAPDRFDGYWLSGLAYLLRHGRARLTQAIAEGQYAFPRGLFYGGEGRQESLRILAEVCAAPELQAARTVLHIDLHTGLGQYAQYQFLLDAPPSAPAFRAFSQWFGAARVRSDHPQSAAHYAAHGTLTQFAMATFPTARVLAATLEFGTEGPAAILKALRAENRWHHYGPRDHPAAIASKARLREALFPSNPAWRAAVIAHGREIFSRLRQALDSGLVEDGASTGR